MNIKLQRVVRTPASEEMVIRDLDQQDREGAARTVGKLDLHFAEEGVYGTLLLWPDVLDTMAKDALDGFVDGIISEVTDLVGVSETYNIELYDPDLKRYKVYSNLPEE